MDKQEILLKEYELCQQDNSSTATRYWVVVGIFMAISTALLGGVAYSIISGSLALHQNVKWLVLILGIGVISIVTLLGLWLRRVNFLMHIFNHRMYEIELELGMKKNWIANCLDNWSKLTDEQKASLTDLCERYPPRRKGSDIAPGLFLVVGILWVAFIAMAFIFSN